MAGIPESVNTLILYLAQICQEWSTFHIWSTTPSNCGMEWVAFEVKFLNKTFLNCLRLCLLTVHRSLLFFSLWTFSSPTLTCLVCVKKNKFIFLRYLWFKFKLVRIRSVQFFPYLAFWKQLLDTENKRKIGMDPWHHLSTDGFHIHSL